MRISTEVAEDTEGTEFFGFLQKAAKVAKGGEVEGLGVGRSLTHLGWDGGGKKG